MTQTPVATIVSSHSYNRLPWLRFADNITAGVSKCCHCYKYGVPIIITVLDLCLASGILLPWKNDNLSF